MTGEAIAMIVFGTIVLGLLVHQWWQWWTGEVS